MKLRIKNFILVTILAFVTIGGTTSCGSKKKLAKKEYEAKVAQAKADLNAIIEGTTEWTLEEQKARVEEIEKSDLQNQEIDALIVKAKEVLARELAEAERAAEEERLRKIEEENRCLKMRESLGQVKTMFFYAKCLMKVVLRRKCGSISNALLPQLKQDL